MELELKRNLESMLHDKERQLEVEIKSRKEASNSNQQVNEKIYSLEKVVSLQRDREREIREERQTVLLVLTDMCTHCNSYKSDSA